MNREEIKGLEVVNFEINDPSICFNTGNVEQGRLYENKQGKMAFSGDVDESARVFVENISNIFNGKLDQLEQELSKYKNIVETLKLCGNCRFIRNTFDGLECLKTTKLTTFQKTCNKWEQPLSGKHIASEPIKIESDNDMSVEDVNFVRQLTPPVELFFQS